MPILTTTALLALLGTGAGSGLGFGGTRLAGGSSEEAMLNAIQGGLLGGVTGGLGGLLAGPAAGVAGGTGVGAAHGMSKAGILGSGEMTKDIGLTKGLGKVVGLKAAGGDLAKLGMFNQGWQGNRLGGLFKGMSGSSALPLLSDAMNLGSAFMSGDGSGMFGGGGSMSKYGKGREKEAWRMDRLRRKLIQQVLKIDKSFYM